MAETSIARARDFVVAAKLPPAPAAVRGAAKAPPVDFDASKAQAAVVASDVIAFAKGVTAQQRQDVCNAVLLAQLVAKRKVPSPETEADIKAWYDEYFDALSNIGFAVQQRSFTQYQKKGSSFEVHEAILEVAAVLLGGAPAALTLVTTTLKALQSMSKDSPWITLFDRESHSTRAARFQISALDGDEEKGFSLSMLAFGLEATSELTQVLFFKFHSDAVQLFHQGGTIAINEQVLGSVREPIAVKLNAFANDFIKALPDDLGAPAPGRAGGTTTLQGSSNGTAT